MLVFPKLRATLIASALTASTSCLAFCIAAPAAHADLTEDILHTFININNDGLIPEAGLTQAADGTFYGTTEGGGTAGYGTVFEITPTGSYNIVHNFGDGSTKNDGADPEATLTIGSDGNIYGTTTAGGAGGYGSVFKMTTAGAVTILHSFADGNDGEDPISALSFGKDGRLYGTTYNGSSSAAEYGTIYSLKTDGSSYLVQYRFGSSNGAAMGENPEGTVAPVPTSSTNQFYGTTYEGGAGSDGVVYEFTPGTSDGSGKLVVLHSFQDGSVANDGALPTYGRLQTDSKGDIFGDTDNGGGNGDGIIYELDTNGNLTILHSFDGSDGETAEGGLSLASDGNYYGTTLYGGTQSDGVVYRVSPSGSNFNVVYNFGDNGSSDGYSPYAKPLEDSDGNLLGTTEEGGDDNGTSEYGILYKLVADLPNPVKLSSLTLSPTSVVGGSANSTATVTLGKPAPTGGAKILLTSANSSVASVPSSVTIAAGSEKASFTVASHSVSSNSSVTITANYNGSTISAGITVTPQSSVSLSSVDLSPTSTTGGASTTANRAYLSGNATADTTVTLTSSNTSVATVPSSVLIKSGSSSHTFTITTKSVTKSTTVTITAKANGVTKTATLTVNPAGPSLQSVLLSPTSLTGGSSSTASRVYLTANATSDVTVNVKSGNTRVATITTPTVTIKTGSSSHVFTIATTKVTSKTTVTITATANGVSKTATLTVNP